MAQLNEARRLEPNDAGGLSQGESLALIESHGVGTWCWQLDGAELRWSAGISAILGLVHDEAAQSLEAYETLVHPDDRADFRNPTRLSSGGTLADREYRILRPDGEMRWVRSHSKLIHSRDGRPARLLGVSFDITDVRQGLHALQQQDGLMEALRGLFDVVIWTTNAGGEITDEVEWWRTTGQRGRVDGWSRLEVVHPDDRQRVRDSWVEALRNRRSYSTSCRVMWGDAYVPVISRASSIVGRNGAIEGWIGFTARQDANAAFDVGVAGDTAPPLTAGQVRAARGYLGWSAEQLAEHAGVSFSTVRRVETPRERGVRDQSLVAIRKALEGAGITFTAGADGRTGVSMK